MAAIRSQNTKPEILIRHWLFAQGYRYRVNVKNVPGHPDLFLRKYNTAIFVHGCFWHRHSGCKYAYTPKTRTEFWEKKFKQNMERDKAVMQELSNGNTRSIVIWECTIKKMQKDVEFRNKILGIFESFLNGKSESCEL